MILLHYLTEYINKLALLFKSCLLYTSTVKHWYVFDSLFKTKGGGTDTHGIYLLHNTWCPISLNSVGFNDSGSDYVEKYVYTCLSNFELKNYCK